MCVCVCVLNLECFFMFVMGNIKNNLRISHHMVGFLIDC